MLGVKECVLYTIFLGDPIYIEFKNEVQRAEFIKRFNLHMVEKDEDIKQKINNSEKDLIECDDFILVV